MSKKIFCLIIFLVLLSSVSQVFAATSAADMSIESTIDYAANIAKFTGTADTILTIARNLFISLATLSLILGLIRMLLTGESNVGTVFAHIAKWLLYVGIFTWMMSSLSSATFIPKIIVNSFVSIASTMGGNIDIAPDDILTSGIRIYGIIVERGWNAGWGDFVGLTVIGIIILVVIAITAGFIAVAIVEMHLVICGGAVLLGFGGFEYTRDIALSYIRYAISVGMKLIMISIVYSLAVTLIPSWADTFEKATDMTQLITQSGQILGGTITVLMIVMIIPKIAQSIVNSASMSFGHNAPVVGHTPYNEVRIAPGSDQQTYGAGLLSNMVNAFRSSRNVDTGTGPQNMPAYTSRADELMFGGSNFNPTHLPNEHQRASERSGAISAETFSNYVAPASTPASMPRPARDR